MKRGLFRIFLTFLCLFGILAAVILYYYQKDYAQYFAGRKGTLVRAGAELARTDSIFVRSWVTLTNNEGFHVDCGLLTPRNQTRRVPAVILLGGKATGKYAVDYAIDIKNVIIIAPDYPFEPRQSYTVTTFLADVPAIRRALLDMVPSVMLVLDYLWRRPDVDTSRIVLLGYSFGAPFVPCIIAHDRRPAVAAMVYGAGELRSLITYNVRRYEGEVASQCVGLLGGLLLRPLEPLRYVDRVSPTPLLMINGSDDEQIPRRNVVMLFEKAKEPKNLIWLPSHHVNPANVELTRLIVATLRKELEALGILTRDRTP